MPEFAATGKKTSGLESLDIVPLNVILQCQESQKQHALLLLLSRKYVTLATIIYFSVEGFCYHFSTAGYQIICHSQR